MTKHTPFILAIFCFLLPTLRALYLPELQLCASTVFLNKQLTKYGPTIEKQLDTAKLSDITFDDKVDGVHVQFNLTNITQKFGINWNGNIINIQDEHSFILLSKNINLTLHGHVDFKVGLALKQKGELVANIEKLETDTTLAFTQPHCDVKNKGVGFDIQIEKLFVNPETISIKIEGKGIDNIVIKALISVLKSRLPSIIEKAAKEKGNPAISKLTCSPVQ